MSKKYLFGAFVLCFCVWAVIIDNMILPAEDNLPQDVGTYTRYRVKKWSKGSKLDIIQDELLIYVVVDTRERPYYMEYKGYFEATLKNLPPGTPVQVRYNRGFPKFWKRHAYSLRENGIPIVRYSAAQLFQKQKEIWKITGIMGGVYLIFIVLGFISRPRTK